MAVVAAASGAMAQEPPVSKTGRFYVGIAPGLVVPEDTNFSASGSSGGYTASASGKFEFKDGYSISAFAGYQFSDYLRAEGELAYARFDYDKITLNGTITGNGRTYTVNGSADLDGSVESTLGLLSAVVSPLGKARVAPLVGGGIGFAATDEQIDRIGGSAANLSSSHTDLALSGMLGIEAAVSDNVRLGARYRYLWVDSGRDGLDNFTAHNFQATAAWAF